MEKVINTQLNITNQSNRSALSQQGIYIIERCIFSRIFNISQRHYPFVFCLFEDVTDCVNKDEEASNVLLHSDSSFILPNNIKTNTTSS